MRKTIVLSDLLPQFTKASLLGGEELDRSPQHCFSGCWTQPWDWSTLPSPGHDHEHPWSVAGESLQSPTLNMEVRDKLWGYFWWSFKVPSQYSSVIPAYNGENMHSLYYQLPFLFGSVTSVLRPQGTRWQDTECLVLPWVLLYLPAILFLLPFPPIIFHLRSGYFSSSPFPDILPSILAASSCFCKFPILKQTPQ